MNHPSPPQNSRNVNFHFYYYHNKKKLAVRPSRLDIQSAGCPVGWMSIGWMSFGWMWIGWMSASHIHHLFHFFKLIQTLLEYSQLILNLLTSSPSDPDIKSIFLAATFTFREFTSSCRGQIGSRTFQQAGLASQQWHNLDGVKLWSCTEWWLTGKENHEETVHLERGVSHVL